MRRVPALACASVDLDALPHYLRLHGLSAEELPEERRHAVGRVALARFLDLFEELGVRATFFAVGEDLDDARTVALVRRAFDAGHEIGNHTQTHPYDLTRRSLDALQAEVARCETTIERVTGRRPIGFRAPGYAIDARLLAVLDARGYAYDSSAFPAVPYYLAKACVMGALELLGRPSRAMLDRPRALAAPRLPYRPSALEPYRRDDGTTRLGLVELPMTVTPLARLPFIGTSALLLPARVLDLVYRRVRRLPFFNFELHGIDLLDATDVNLPDLSAVQRDLNIPFTKKRARLARVLSNLRRDFDVRPLASAAGALREQLAPRG
ncbi:MAG: polysaccharide deacetylase family protein [Myxococcales bacterium]|jgi:peptidoglycan/xylan/chitin deacetylase (PgdA/CDA1 family)|nr:polysaccharide deacetylase family protein [Myxococcales bacterium]